jgi:hypothetical protein
MHVRPRGCPLPPPTPTIGDDAFHCNLRPPHANPSPNSIEDSLCTSQVGCTHPHAPTVPSSKQHAVRRRRRVEFGQQSTQSSRAHLTSLNGPHSTIPLPLTFPRPSTLANVAAAQKSASLLPLPTPLPPLSSVLGNAAQGLCSPPSRRVSRRSISTCSTRCCTKCLVAASTNRPANRNTWPAPACIVPATPRGRYSRRAQDRSSFTQEDKGSSDLHFTAEIERWRSHPKPQTPNPKP